MRGAGIRRRDGARAAALLAAALGAALACGCTSRSASGGGGEALSTQRWYVDKNDRVYHLAIQVIHELRGEVVAENPVARAVTARFPEEMFGHGVFLDVSVERSNDESWVTAGARSESTPVAKEDLELLRERFFEALDEAVTQTR